MPGRRQRLASELFEVCSSMHTMRHASVATGSHAAFAREPVQHLRSVAGKLEALERHLSLLKQPPVTLAVTQEKRQHLHARPSVTVSDCQQSKHDASYIRGPRLHPFHVSENADSCWAGLGSLYVLQHHVRTYLDFFGVAVVGCFLGAALHRYMVAPQPCIDIYA